MSAKLIIVGSGMAGAAAAVAATKAGADVTLLTAGFGGTAASCGSFLARGDDAVHPIPETYKAVFETLLPGWLVLDEPRMAVNVFGTLTPMSVLAPWNQAAVIDTSATKPRTVAVAGLHEDARFWANFAVRNLEPSLRETAYSFKAVTLPPLDIPGDTPVTIAAALDDDIHFEALANALQKAVADTGADILLLPPVLGMQPAGLAQRLSERLKVQVGEMWAPWGAAGVRFTRHLDAVLAQAGVQRIEGRATGLDRSDDGAITAVKYNDAEGAEASLAVDSAVVLALGGSLLHARDMGIEHLRPPVDLPWEMTEDDWMQRDPNELFSRDIDAKHPALSFGVHSDERLRPLDVHDRLWSPNCFMAGDILAGSRATRGGLQFAFTTGCKAAGEALDARKS